MPHFWKVVLQYILGENSKVKDVYHPALPLAMRELGESKDYPALISARQRYQEWCKNRPLPKKRVVRAVNNSKVVKLQSGSRR